MCLGAWYYPLFELSDVTRESVGGRELDDEKYEESNSDILALSC